MMPEYQGQSFDELRLEAYMKNGGKPPPWHAPPSLEFSIQPPPTPPPNPKTWNLPPAPFSAKPPTPYSSTKPEDVLKSLQGWWTSAAKPPAPSSSSTPSSSSSAPSSSSTPSSSTAGPAAFSAASTFQGKRDGYVFKKGAKGLGYYLDDPAAASTAGAAAGPTPTTWSELVKQPPFLAQIGTIRDEAMLQQYLDTLKQSDPQKRKLIRANSHAFAQLLTAWVGRAQLLDAVAAAVLGRPPLLPPPQAAAAAKPGAGGTKGVVPASSSSAAAATTNIITPKPFYIFEWEDGAYGSNTWVAYATAHNQELNNAYRDGLLWPSSTKKPLELTIGSRCYMVDVFKKTQRQKETGYVRRIRLRLPGMPIVAAARATGAGADAANPPPLDESKQLYNMADYPRDLWDDGEEDDDLDLHSFPGTLGTPPTYWKDFEPCPTAAALQLSILPKPVDHQTVSDVIDQLYVQYGEPHDAKIHGFTPPLPSRYIVRDIRCFRDETRWVQYAARKVAMEKQLGKDKVHETWLWHGTREADLQQILTNGFLRDFNSTSVYGKGTYFARDACYALQTKYAKPHGISGDQTLLLVRVLVGESCKGSSKMDKPIAKPGSTKLYESMVDDLHDPHIYVLSAGSDNQAFPEFVLRVRKPELKPTSF